MPHNTKKPKSKPRRRTGPPAEQCWIPRDEAAEFLGVAARTLQETADKYPEQLRSRRPSLAEPAVYNEADLVALKERREKGISMASFQREARAGWKVETKGALMHVAGGAVVQAAANGAPTAAKDWMPDAGCEPMYLTVKQAARVSGLPASFLQAKCDDGSIGINVGSELHRVYRISRKDLEAVA